MGLLKYMSNALVTVDRFVDNLIDDKKNPWDSAYQSMKAEHIRDYEENPEGAALYLEACRKERIAETSRDISEWATDMVKELKVGFKDDKIGKASLDDLLDRVEKVRLRMIEHIKHKNSGEFEDNDAFMLQCLCERRKLDWHELPV